MMNKRLLIGTSAVVALVTGACTSPEGLPGDRVVELGAVIDQTGPSASPSWRVAAELAIDHANQGLARAGGFKGLAFRLGFSDSVSNEVIALKRARRLVKEHGVKGLVTDTTANALVLNATHYDSDRMNDLGVPLVCMACTSPSFGDESAVHPTAATQGALRDPNGWAYRTSSDSRPEARSLLNAAHALGVGGDLNGDGVWKLALYLTDSEVGSGLLQTIRVGRDQHFPLVDRDGNLRRDGLRLEVVRHPPDVDVNAYDWAGDVRRLVDGVNEEPEINPGFQKPGEPIPDELVDGVPDAIIDLTLPLFAASLTRSYAEAGQAVAKIPFIHQHGWRHDTTLVKLRAAQIAGHQGVSPVVVDNCATSGAVLSRGLQERLGRGAGLWDAQTYDAVMTLALATLVAAGAPEVSDPAALTGAEIRLGMSRLTGAPGATKVSAGPEGFASAIEATRAGLPIDYDGASGPVDFDRSGNVRTKFVRFRFTEGRFADEALFDCISRPDDCPLIETDCAL